MKLTEEGKAMSLRMILLVLAMLLLLLPSGRTTAAPTPPSGNHPATLLLRLDGFVWLQHNFTAAAFTHTSDAGAAAAALNVDDNAATSDANAAFYAKVDDDVATTPLVDSNDLVKHDMHTSSSKKRPGFEVSTARVEAALWIAIVINIKLVVSRCLGRNRNVICILFAAAVVLGSVTQVNSDPQEQLPEIVGIDFQVTAESYDSFFDAMHSALASNTEAVEGHYILPKETPAGQKPPRWIEVTLIGGDTQRIAMLLFRADTAYLYGFINDADMFCAKGTQDMFPIAGCTQLPFRDNYSELTGRLDGQDLNTLLTGVLMGRSAARVAATALAEYGNGVTSPIAARKSMLLFALMIAEAQRFKPIGDKVKADWLTSSYLTKPQADLIFVWRDLSILWCRGDDPQDGQWSRARDKLEALGILTRADVARALDIVKNENKCSQLRKEKPPAKL